MVGGWRARVLGRIGWRTEDEIIKRISLIIIMGHVTQEEKIHKRTLLRRQTTGKIDKSKSHSVQFRIEMVSKLFM